MQIICAGFPKTGTKSMALALRQLGYTVHDFEEHIEYNIDNYLDMLEGRASPDILQDMYRDIDVVVDQPACTMWHIILSQFPTAKVILSERESASVWFQSYIKMLKYYEKNHKPYLDWLHPWVGGLYAKWHRMIVHNMIRSAATDTLLDNVSPDSWMNQYTIHNAAVKQIVPASQLLVFQVGEGWERLCAFLDKEVPTCPFPRENVGGEKGNIVDQMMKFTFLERAEREFRRNAAILVATAVGALLAFSKFRKHLS